MTKRPAHWHHRALQRAFAAGGAVLCLAAASTVDGQCTPSGTPSAFEPNPPGVARPQLLSSGASSGAVVYHNASGAPRLLMSETFGYSVLDLSNPGNPTALKYDDLRFDTKSSTTNPVLPHGDGQSYIATISVSPDGQRVAFSMNGPADPPWHTLAGRTDGQDGFGMWGDFRPNRAKGTVVQHVNSRYIAYALSASLTAADITTLPTSNSAFGPLNIPFDTTSLPGGQSLLLAGNYLVYATAGGVSVFDASNPGPAGNITSAYKSVTIGSLSSDPNGRMPVNFTAAVDPIDATKLWVLAELGKAAGESAPSFGLVAVTRDLSGNLTATASPGLFRVPSQAGESWLLAGNSASLVAANGSLFVLMWGQRSTPSQEFVLFSTTTSAWPVAGVPGAVVSAPGFGLAASTASVLAGSGTSVYQYLPTGQTAFVVPLSCQPVNVPTVSSLTVTNTSAGVVLQSGDSAFFGDTLTIAPTVGPSPAINPLTSWDFDFDFHPGSVAEDSVGSVTPRVRNPDLSGGAGTTPPATLTLVGPCDPTNSGIPASGAGCWTSVQSNSASGGPDFSASPSAKPLDLAFEATNHYGSANTAVFSVNWVVPAAKIASTQVFSGQNLVSASDGHPTGFKWYFGTLANNLALASLCTGPTCVPTSGSAAGTYYYWLTATYANGYGTRDYVAGTTSGLPFTIASFLPVFTVNGSAAGPVTAIANQTLAISNSSRRANGITGSYLYDLCPSPCSATYSSPTGGVLSGMTDPPVLTGAPPTTASLAVPSTPGSYLLRFRIDYPGGSSYWPGPTATAGFPLTVTNPPPPVVVTASASPNPAPAGTTVQFSCSATGGTGTYASYSWSSGSFTFSALQNPTLRATNSGSQPTTTQATCTVTDSAGNSGSATLTLTINPPPPPIVVTVGATPNPATNGDTVQFTCSATGGSGTFSTYSWSSTGGSFSSLQNPAIRVTNPGSTPTTTPEMCTATDSSGNSASASLTLTVRPTPPPIVVSVGASPNPLGYGQATSLTCSATGGTGAFTYTWSASDGAAGVGSTLAHAFGSTGTYTATCRALDAGTSLTAQNSVTVNVTLPPGAGGPYSFYVVTPCRILDTRSPAGALAGPSIQPAGSADRTFAVASTCGIPPDAKSIAVNATVTNVAALGAVSLYRGDGPQTGTSTASLVPGKTRANNGLVQLALDGSGTIKAQNTSSGTFDLILDVNGYYR